MSKILSDIYNIIECGVPLPLSWVVGNADAFPSAWASCEDPQLMLRIAAHVVTRQQLVAAVCAVVRTAIQKNELGALRAVRVAKAWARGEATIDEVKVAAVKVKIDATRDLHTAATDIARAAYYAARAAYATDAVYVADYAANASANVIYATTSVYDDGHIYDQNHKLAVIIRKHIHITIADLVRAGKNGWQP